MKKYKHKITGNIATETKSESNYKVSEPRNFTVPKWIIENSNDWEEVKNKEWEILSFKYGNGCPYFYNLLLNGKYSSSGIKQDQYTLVKMLEDVKDCSCVIHSVKRLSDGEVFTIGDKINTTLENGVITTTINEIKNYSECLYIYTKQGVFVLAYISKAKQPLFTTEDGIDIYYGQSTYGVRIFDSHYSGIFRWNEGEFTKGSLCNNLIKYFSTKEAAINYIIKNKPCLSYQELLDLCHVDSNNRLEVYASSVKTFIKNKLEL